jgi:hypothetical protein
MMSTTVMKRQMRPPATTVKEAVGHEHLSQAKAEMWRTKYKALKTIGAADHQVEECYKQAFDAAVENLYAYYRLGELVDPMTATPSMSGMNNGKGGKPDDTFASISKLARQYATDKSGVGVETMRKKLNDAKTIFLNPQYIRTIINDTWAKKSLPTRSKVLLVIHAGVGRTGKRTAASQKTQSKHEQMKEGNKKLAIQTEFSEFNKSVENANSFFRAVIQGWLKAPEGERERTRANLVRFQGYFNDLATSLGYPITDKRTTGK